GGEIESASGARLGSRAAYFLAYFDQRAVSVPAAAGRWRTDLPLKAVVIGVAVFAAATWLGRRARPPAAGARAGGAGGRAAAGGVVAGAGRQPHVRPPAPEPDRVRGPVPAAGVRDRRVRGPAGRAGSRRPVGRPRRADRAGARDGHDLRPRRPRPPARG